MPELTVVSYPLDDLNPYYRNPRKGNVAEIAASLAKRGQYRPIVVNIGTHTGRPNEVLAGNHTVLAARSLGWESIEATTVDVDHDAAAQIVLADNRLADLGGYDNEALAELLAGLNGDLEGTGYSTADLDNLLSDGAGVGTLSLADRFGAAPLSVLTAREGPWLERKSAWRDLGLHSEVGREGALVFDSPQTYYINWWAVKNKAEAAVGHKLSSKEVIADWSHELQFAKGAGTSVFDPALSELLVSWFSAPGAHVIDPWAGGSVRGVVSGALGRRYTGVELRPEQVEANREQLPVIKAALDAGIAARKTEEPEWVAGSLADVLGGMPAESFDLAFSAPPRYSGLEVGAAEPAEFVDPEWIEGESTEQLRELDAASFDLAFGCPPYYDLEKYSDDPRDLSNMTVAEFDRAMAANIAAVARVLREDSFAVFVVGSVRDRRGRILDMRRCMSAAAEAADLWLVNDAVLLTPIASAATRAARGFTSTRVFTRVHQEVLVYCKGDRKRAAARCGNLEPGSVLRVRPDNDDE